MTFRIGCTNFADFTNAGNATTEGFNVKENVAKVGGSGAPNTKNIPTDTGYRTPSFAPLMAVVGNFLVPYNNCNLDGAASAFPVTGGLRTENITTLSAQGVTCPGVFDYHTLYTSSMRAYGHSQTKWSGAHGNGTIRFGASGPSSAAGTDLMPKADGACWIASIDYHFAQDTEEANIFERTVSGVVTWAISSTADGSAYAQCIKYDQW